MPPRPRDNPPLVPPLLKERVSASTHTNGGERSVSSRVERLYRAHAPRIWRLLRRFGVSETDAADLCQEVFVVALRKLPEFEGRSSEMTWLYGIAWRVASQHRRKMHRRAEIPVANPTERLSTPPEQEDRADLGRRLAVAYRLLEELEEKQRAVFVLYEIEGLPMKQVVEVLGCPLQTGYTRLHAARRRFEEAARRWRREEGTS